MMWNVTDSLEILLCAWLFTGTILHFSKILEAMIRHFGTQKD